MAPVAAVPAGGFVVSSIPVPGPSVGAWPPSRPADPGHPPPLRRRDRPTLHTADPYDFNDEVRGGRTDPRQPKAGSRSPPPSPARRRPKARLDDFVAPQRRPRDQSSTPTAYLLERKQRRRPLGPPARGTHDFGDMRVATAAMRQERTTSPATSSTGAASDRRRRDNRPRLGSRPRWHPRRHPASHLAGVRDRRRAMRPVASLTAEAREIATTRDPSPPMPQPAADDEVGELAARWTQMLRSLDAARGEREGRCRRSASSSPTPRTSCAPR